MSWPALPLELEDLILANLSLCELARASRACHTFQSAFRKQLAIEQDARSQIAIHIAGLARIEGIVSLTKHYIQGDADSAKLKGNVGRISADGTLHVQRSHPFLPQPPFNPGGIDASFLLDGLSLSVRMEAVLQSEVCINVYRQHGLVDIYVCPRSDEDFDGVSLVQCLLGSALGPCINEGGLAIDVHVRGYSTTCTCTGLQAQVVPLLPLASRIIYAKWVKGVNVWQEENAKRDAQFGDLGPANKKGITVHVDYFLKKHRKRHSRG
jgi:hypothetical protein